jgi:hypothetical protein
MARDTSTLVRLAALALTALVAAAAEIAALAMDGPDILTVLALNPFAQFACAGTYAMYRLWEPHAARAHRAALVGASIALVPLAGVPFEMLDSLRGLGLALLALGAVGLGCIVVRAIEDSPERTVWRGRLAAALYVPLATSMTPFFLWLSGRINPVYDLYVFAFEDTLGVRLPVLAVRLFEDVPAIGTVSGICYYALPLGIAALFVLQERGRMQADILVGFALSALIGFSLYFVFPVVGPLTVYGDAFPDALPPLGSVVAKALVIETGAPRNGMPSLHTAWALLIWFNARGLAPLPRAGFRLFAALNLLATIGLHDAHWATDLVVGAPVAVAVQALCGTAAPLLGARRWLGAGAALVIIWLWFAALRWGVDVFAAVPGLSWAAVAATIAALALLLRWQDAAGPDAALPRGALQR